MHSLRRTTCYLTRRRAQAWAPLLAFAGILAAWELVVRANVLPARFFPAPTMIVRALVRLATHGPLIENLSLTLRRLSIGVVAGGVPAILFGLTMGWARRLRSVVDPLIAAVHPVPKISLLPLLFAMFGIGEASRIVLIAVAAFFPLVINAMAAVRQISPIHFEAAADCGASPFKVLSRVILPGSLPMLLAGMRLSLNIALTLAISVELITPHDGLGSMIWIGWQTMRVENICAVVFVTAALGITFNSSLQWLTRRLVPWQVERTV